MRDHAQALQEVVRELQATPGTLPDVIGHRLVNGGPSITEHSRVDESVLAELLAHQDLAPIHNPPAIATIQACRETFPGLPQVVISDTAFHRTIPQHARTYAIPRAISARLGHSQVRVPRHQPSVRRDRNGAADGHSAGPFLCRELPLGQRRCQSVCRRQRRVDRQHDGLLAAAGTGHEHSLRGPGSRDRVAVAGRRVRRQGGRGEAAQQPERRAGTVREFGRHPRRVRVRRGYPIGESCRTRRRRSICGD